MHPYELGSDEDLGNTGAYLLNLCAGRRKLHITGRDVVPAIALNAREIEDTITVHNGAERSDPDESRSTS